MTKEYLENILTEYGVAFTDSLADRLLKEFEPCEDCISRQSVNTLIDELARAISDERCCLSRGRSTATIMRDILHLPPVTPTCEEREKGECPYYAG